MPRFDKFFEGAAAGIPQGYRMGLAYQEEQRAKAQDARAAELHGRNIKAADQLYSFNETFNPLRVAAQQTENDAAMLAHENNKRFAARERQLGLDVDQFNLDEARRESNRKTANLDAVGNSMTALYGNAPGNAGWNKFLSGPMPKNPEAAKVWKSGRMLLDNPAYKTTINLMNQFAQAKGKGLTPETYALMEKNLKQGLAAASEQGFDTFEDVYARAASSGNFASHAGVINQMGVNLSPVGALDNFLVNTEVDAQGNVTTFKVYPQVDAKGNIVGYTRNQWKTYTPEDVTSGAMRRDMMSWGAFREAPSETAGKSATEQLDARRKAAETAIKEKEAAADGRMSATDAMKAVSDISRNDPALSRIVNSLTSEQYSRVASMMGGMGGDPLTNLTAAIKAVKYGLKLEEENGQLLLSNPQTGAVVDPQLFPLE